MSATTTHTTLLGLLAPLGNRILVWRVNDTMHTACRLLDKQGMQNAYPAQTPIPASIKLLPATPDDKLADIKEYQSIVGSLQYLACVSRPDIAYTASTLGSFNAKPSVVHLNVAKHVVCYLKHSAKLGITFSRCDSSSLTGYTDANYFHSGADSVNIGYVFKIAGGAVTWRSKKVKSAIPQSTAEAELCALNAGVFELQWICDLLEQLHIDMPKPTLCDNQAATTKLRQPSCGYTGAVWVTDREQQALLLQAAFATQPLPARHV